MAQRKTFEQILEFWRSSSQSDFIELRKLRQTQIDRGDADVEPLSPETVNDYRNRYRQELLEYGVHNVTGPEFGVPNPIDPFDNSGSRNVIRFTVYPDPNSSYTVDGFVDDDFLDVYDEGTISNLSSNFDPNEADPNLDAVFEDDANESSEPSQIQEPSVSSPSSPPGLTMVFEYTNFSNKSDFYPMELPIRFGQTSPSVEMVKLYFGLAQYPGDNTGYFDNTLRLKIRSWQDQYSADIASKIDSGPIAINSFTEQGEVGPVTFAVMQDRGFLRAVKEFLESQYFFNFVKNSGFGESGAPVESAFEYPERIPEAQSRPQYDKDFVSYTIVTDYTEVDFSTVDQMVSDKATLRRILRDGVTEVFNFYDKPRVWIVDGAPPPDFPIAENLYGDPVKIRSQYNDIVKANTGGDVTFTEDNQQFRFTINRIPPEVTTPEYDVLAKQPVAPGATIMFAGISKIVPPSPRPTSTYSVTLKIKRNLFDEIAGGNTVDLLDPQLVRDRIKEVADTYDDYSKKAKSLYKKAGKAVDVLQDPSKLNDQIDKAVDGAKRKAAKAAKKIGKDMWNQAKTGQGGITDAEAADAAAEAARTNRNLRNGEVTGPKKVRLKLNQIREKVNNVAALMEEYHQEIEDFKIDNAPSTSNSSRFETQRLPIIPDVRPRDEARRLREILPALDEFLSVQGYSLDSSAPADEKYLEFEFFPVTGIVNQIPPPDESTTSANQATSPDESPEIINLDNLPSNRAEQFKTCIGYQVVKVTYIDDKAVPKISKDLNAGDQIFDPEDPAGKMPLINFTTMGYFAQLEEILETTIPKSCEELDDRVASVAFFTRHHWPTLTFNFNKKYDDRIFSLDATIDVEGVKDGEYDVTTVRGISGLVDTSITTAMQAFQENKALLNKNLDNMLQSLSFKNRGQVIRTPDVYPDFGKIACDIDGIWDEFINQFDMKWIMCDFYKCIPDIPRFNWSFSWTLPSLPRIPLWDPMSFVLPQIRIAINDIILSFVCKLITDILKTLKRPDCTDLIRFGLASYSELQKLKRERDAKLNGPTFSPDRADAALEATETFKNMGITDYRVSGEEEDFLETVSISLTPTEFCDLLSGQATEEVLKIVKRIVDTTTTALRSYLTSLTKIEQFFTTLGTVVDPFICDRIEELNDIIISQELCRNDQDLRSLLLENGATEEQIREEIEALGAKRDALNQLSKQGDFSSLLPGMSPEQLAEAGLPGPYTNTFHSNMVKRAVATVLTVVKDFYAVDISSISDKIIDESFKMIEPGEEGFNKMAYLKYKYYSKQLFNLEQDPETIPKRMGDFKPTILMQFTGNDPVAIMDQYEIPVEYRPYFNYLPTEGSEFETYDEFMEAVELHVNGYVEKYTVIVLSVFQTLRDVLEKDNSSIARKFPNLVTGLREFNIALFTTNIDEIPFDIAASIRNKPRGMVAMTEVGFSTDNVKDCYKVSYAAGPGGNSVVKTYHEDLPQPVIELRRSHLDVAAGESQSKLLRPNGFAFLLISKYLELANNRPGRNTFEDYQDGEQNIIPKLSGYVEDYNPQEARDLFDTLLESEDLEGLGGALVALLLAGLAAASGISEKAKEAPLYNSVVDSFNFQISNLIRKSKFFDVSNVLDLESDASQDYKVNKNCYVKNEKSLDFEKFIDKFEEIFDRVVSNPKHNPEIRDFTKKGPLDEAMLEMMVKLYVNIYALDMCLKSMFMLSQVGAKSVMDSQFMLEYITEGVLNELKEFAVSSRTTRKLNRIARSLTDQDNTEEAFRSLITRNLDISEIVELANEMYESKYDSFKDLVYNEMAENVRDVASFDDYPKATLLSNLPADQDLNFSQYVDQYAALDYIAPDDVLVVDQADSAVLDGIVETLEDQGVSTEVTPGSLNRDEANRLRAYSENFGGFRDFNLCAKLPNMYDRFAFEGYDDALIQKKINSGHFWVEKFYRISNFRTFKRIYNGLVGQVESLPSIDGAQTVGRLKRITNAHSQYISAGDLELMLFGRREVGDVNNYINNLQRTLEASRAEMFFAKMVFLSMLSSYFRSNGKQNSVPMRVMSDLCMSYIEPEQIQEDLENFRPGRALSKPIVVDTSGFSNTDRILTNVAITGQPPYRGTSFDNVFFIITAEEVDSPSVQMDLAYRNGTVTKQQLYERVKERFETGYKVFNGELPPDTAVGRNWSSTMPDDFRHNPDFGKVASDYSWVAVYDFAMQYSNIDKELLSLDRKAEIFTDCLTKFVELAHNWIRSSSPPDADVHYFSPKCRSINEVLGSGLSEQKEANLLKISRGVPAGNERFRYNRNPPASDLAEFGITQSDLFNRNNSPLPYSIELMHNFYDMPGFTSARNVEESTADRGDWVINSGLYEKGNELQETILSQYISEVITVSSRVSFAESRGGVFNIPAYIDQNRRDLTENEGRLIFLDAVDQYELGTIPEEQEKLYQHLTKNLHVGYRLMFGHAVSRFEEDYMGTNDGTIEPSAVFQDLIGLSGEAIVRGGELGLPTGRSVFSDKRAFLGHVENNPPFITSGESTQGSPNSDSVFYENVLKVTSNVPSFAFSNAREPDLSVNISPMTDAIKSKTVFCIPIDEVVEKIDCFEDLYQNYAEEVRGYFAELVSQGVVEQAEVLDSDNEVNANAMRAIAAEEQEKRERLLEQIQAAESRVAAVEAIPFMNRNRLQEQSLRANQALLRDFRSRLETAERLIAYYEGRARDFETGRVDTAEVLDTSRELQERNLQLQDLIDRSGSFYEPFGDDPTATSITPTYRRKFLSNKLFDLYEDKLLESLLSLGPRVRGKRVVVPSTSPEETTKAHRLLFEHYFPLDRYTSLHFLQNAEVFEDNKGDQDMLRVTKLAIIQNMIAMEGITNSDAGATDAQISDMQSTMASNAGSEGESWSDMSITEILELIAKAIKNAAIKASVAAYRSLANAVDPGYRDMRKGYLKDPCSMKDGLVTRLVTSRTIDKVSGNLDKGFGKRNGCKVYIPLNNMPADMTEGIINSLQGEPELLVKTVKHLRGLMQNKDQRYGYFFTPFGSLALHLRENDGEKHSKLKKKNNCEDGCETKPPVEAEGKCEEKEGR